MRRRRGSVGLNSGWRREDFGKALEGGEFCRWGGEDGRSQQRVEVVRARRDDRNGCREEEIGWLTAEGGNWRCDREMGTGKES